MLKVWGIMKAHACTDMHARTPAHSRTPKLTHTLTHMHTRTRTHTLMLTRVYAHLTLQDLTEILPSRDESSVRGVSFSGVEAYDHTRPFRGQGRACEEDEEEAEGRSWQRHASRWGARGLLVCGFWGERLRAVPAHEGICGFKGAACRLCVYEGKRRAVGAFVPG